MEGMMKRMNALIVIFVALCLPSPSIAASPPESTLAIWNINLCDNRKCHTGEASYAVQIGHIADMVNAISSQKTPPLRWDLIGLNEAFAHREGDFVFGVGWNIRYVADEIDCRETRSTILTTLCFNAHLRNSSMPRDWTDQKGEVGIIARSDIFTKTLGGNHRNLSSAASGLAGRVRRNLLGHRFMIKAQGYVLPFYSTHLTGKRVGELDDLLDAMKDWWQPGDLTPVLVGDFNFDSGEPELFARMTNYFTLVGAGEGANNSIEQIWVGKPDKFPGSVGAMRMVRFEYFREFLNVEGDLSDHPVSYAELITAPEDCLHIVPDTLQVTPKNGKFYVTRGQNIILLEFPSSGEANTALGMLQGYSIDKHCFVGRPNVTFTYYLVSDSAPAGERPNEDCLAFNPTSLIVRRDNGLWKIMQGAASVKSFDQSEGAAYRALNLIRHYNFTRQCFVGRPNPGMEYWRR
jgi:hypothetical protein